MPPASLAAQHELLSDEGFRKSWRSGGMNILLLAYYIVTMITMIHQSTQYIMHSLVIYTMFQQTLLDFVSARLDLGSAVARAIDLSFQQLHLRPPWIPGIPSCREWFSASQLTPGGFASRQTSGSQWSQWSQWSQFTVRL